MVAMVAPPGMTTSTFSVSHRPRPHAEHPTSTVHSMTPAGRAHHNRARSPCTPARARRSAARARITYDDDALLLLRLHGRPGVALTSDATAHDSSVWLDDVASGLPRTSAAARVLPFCVNSLGVIRDSRSQTPPGNRGDGHHPGGMDLDRGAQSTLRVCGSTCRSARCGVNLVYNNRTAGRRPPGHWAGSTGPAASVF